MAKQSTAKAELERQHLIAQLVDELGALETELAPLKPKFDRIEGLRRALRAWFDIKPADQSCTAPGEKFIAELGPRAVERTAHPGRLIAVIGVRKYASLAVPTLRALEANLSPEVLAGAITSARTGPRPIKLLGRPGV